MSPLHKIKREILLACDGDIDIDLSLLTTSESIDEAYDEYRDITHDRAYNFREGEVETNIPPETSRHYKSKSVACQTDSGEWIGWTYWYGGGKYGEPEAIDWMESAYLLDCKEEEKMVVVRTFKKKG